MKTLKVIFNLLCLICIGMSGKSFAGMHDNWKDNDGRAVCMFQSTIEKSDLIPFKNNLQSGCHQLILSSNGGDVETAIAMGRLIREKQIFVTTWDKGRCASACVFLYAAGVERVPWGPVLIHRPYSASGVDMPYETTQKKYKELELTAKSFLRHMNVSESLFDRMMRIRPEDAETLTLEEMENLGMGMRDPVYSEYLDNKRASAWKIGKAEWLKRKRSTRNRCGDIDGIIPEGDNGKMRSCWNEVFPQYMSMPNEGFRYQVQQR